MNELHPASRVYPESHCSRLMLAHKKRECVIRNGKGALNRRHQHLGAANFESNIYIYIHIYKYLCVNELLPIPVCACCVREIEGKEAACVIVICVICITMNRRSVNCLQHQHGRSYSDSARPTAKDLQHPTLVESIQCNPKKSTHSESHTSVGREQGFIYLFICSLLTAFLAAASGGLEGVGLGA